MSGKLEEKKKEKRKKREKRKEKTKHGTRKVVGSSPNVLINTISVK